jgi:hypothetical protein
MHKRSFLALAGVAVLAMGAVNLVHAEGEANNESTTSALPAIAADDTAFEPSAGRPKRGEKGMIHVETRPAGLVVFYDGEERGKTPFTAEVPSGRGDVTVMMDDYQFSLGRANVFPGKTSNLYYEIKGQFGIVKVKVRNASEKNKAEVLIDDRLVGRNMGDWLTISGKSNEMRAGKHFLKVRGAAGMAAQEIQIKPEDTTKVEITLKK